MVNDNHLSSVPCYNGTMLKQDYYNDFFDIGQQKINFSFYEYKPFMIMSQYTTYENVPDVVKYPPCDL